MNSGPHPLWSYLIFTFILILLACIASSPEPASDVGSSPEAHAFSPAAPTVIENEQRDFLERAFHDPTAIFTLLLSFVTGGLWYSTWRGMRDAFSAAKASADAALASLEVARDTAQKQLRAYLTLELATFHIVRTEKAEEFLLNATCRITNRGTTPAHKVLLRGGFSVAQHPLPIDQELVLDPINAASVRESIQPGEETTPFVARKLSIKSATLKHDDRIHLVAAVNYEDIYGVKQFTQISGSFPGTFGAVQSAAGGRGQTALSEFVKTTQGNYAT